MTVANPSVIHTAQVTVVVGVRDEEGDVTITSHETGDTVDSRVVSVAGHVSAEVVGDVDRIVVTSNGVDTEEVIGLNGSFNADVVVAIGDNVIEARAYRGSTPVTGRDVVNVLGVQSTVNRRNALLASRVAFVLRWNTAGTDVDIYSTASDGTLWYQNLVQGSGSLDYDDVFGFGPEVISYRADDNSIYVNGTFRRRRALLRGQRINALHTGCNSERNGGQCASSAEIRVNRAADGVHVVLRTQTGWPGDPDIEVQRHCQYPVQYSADLLRVPIGPVESGRKDAFVGAIGGEKHVVDDGFGFASRGCGLFGGSAGGVSLREVRGGDGDLAGQIAGRLELGL